MLTTEHDNRMSAPESPGSLHERSLWGVQVALLLSLFWLVLTGGAGWGFGLAFIGLGALTGATLTPARYYRWNPWRLLVFLGFFLHQSWLGGWDVARRALSPALPLDPCRIVWTLRLPPGQPRTLMVSVVSLLPGTLSVDLHGDTLRVHSLAGDPKPGLAALEDAVARLFGLERNAHD